MDMLNPARHRTLTAADTQVFRHVHAVCAYFMNNFKTVFPSSLGILVTANVFC